MEKMKALVVKGPYDAEITEVDKPVAKDDYIVIKVKKVGLCATDMAIFDGSTSFVKDGQIKYPVRIGHEWSGIVESVGDKVKGFKAGDRVFSDCAVTCGKCDACKAGNKSGCTDVRSLGTVHTWDGCYAEYMYIPERNLYHLSDNVSFDEGALIEPTCISYDAFTDYKLSKDDTVVVFGTGAIGLGAVWLAKYFGVKKVIIVGRNTNKLEKALKIGADDYINAKEKDAASAILSMTGGKGADLIIEATGSEAAFIQSLQAVKAHGRISILSFYDKLLSNIPLDQAVLKCVHIRGGAGCFDYPAVVHKIMSEYDVKISNVISHHVKFADCLDCFYHPEKYAKEKTKIIIDFD